MSQVERAEAAEARVAELEEALRPLAHPFAFGEPMEWRGELEIDCCVSITFDDVLRARAALRVEGDTEALAEEHQA